MVVQGVQLVANSSEQRWSSVENTTQLRLAKTKVTESVFLDRHLLGNPPRSDRTVYFFCDVYLWSTDDFSVVVKLGWF